MRTNTVPRIPRDRLSPGKALAAQLVVALSAWALIYLVWESAMKLAGR